MAPVISSLAVRPLVMRDVVKANGLANGDLVGNAAQRTAQDAPLVHVAEAVLPGHPIGLTLAQHDVRQRAKSGR